MLDIGDLLPPGFPIPEGQETINVAPIPNGLQEAIEEKSRGAFHTDLLNLFSQGHLDKMVTHFSKVVLPASDASPAMPSTAATDDCTSTSTNSSAPFLPHVAQPRITSHDREDHPEWLRLSETIAKVSHCPPVTDRDGHTCIVQAHLRQCATAIKNLWEGSVYDKSLDYLLRYLLLTWLAPERAAANKERARMYAKKMAAKDASKNMTPNKLGRSHWRHSMRKLLDKMAACLMNDRPDGIERLVLLIQALYAKKPAPGVKEKQPCPPLPPPTSRSATPNDDDDDDDNDDDNELDRVLDEVEIELQQLDQEATEPKSHDGSEGNSHMETDSDCTSSSGSNTTKAPKKNEPCRRTLRRLQALIKVLVESPCEKVQYDLDHVKQSVFKGSSFSEEELQVALRITNFLRPFVPRRWKSCHDKNYRQHTPHITLRAPLAIITNSVLRILSRTEFPRRIAPSVAAGSLHGLQLGASQLFDSLCSSSPGHYDVVGVYGDITSVADVSKPRENKQMLFKGFFDMVEIDTMCRRHGFQFGQRYVPIKMHLAHERT
jgi:hypothetical protein